MSSSKYSRPDRRSSEIRRRTVDSCQWIAAASIAALGSIFNAALQHNLAAPQLVTAVRQGQVGQLLASLPPARRGVVAEAVRGAFAAGLNDLLFVTAGLACAGAVCALLLIRSQDFVRRDGAEVPGVSPAAAEAGRTA
jgi:hypothetical protein